MAQYPNVVILTGAGVSAESGAPTYRSAGGLWSDDMIQKVATIEALRQDRWGVNAFYNEHRMNVGKLLPNPAHVALARWEDALGDGFTVITQNVDRLHEQAGSRRVIHMHGVMESIRCDHCRETYNFYGAAEPDTACERCGKTGGLRPDIIFFGEIPKKMDAIHNAIGRCDLFVAIGTSAVVYPASELVHLANLVGAYAIEVNLSDTLKSLSFDECLTGTAGEVVPALVERMLADAPAKSSSPDNRGGTW